MARRQARVIYVVRIGRYDHPDAEEFEQEYRFTSERSANAFARKVDGDKDLDYVNVHPAPLFFSARAALEVF